MTNSCPHSPLSLPSVHLYYSMGRLFCQPFCAKNSKKFFEKRVDKPVDLCYNIVTVREEHHTEYRKRGSEK